MSPFAPENLVSRDRFGRPVPSRVSLSRSFFTPRLNHQSSIINHQSDWLVLAHGFFLSLSTTPPPSILATAIGLVSSLSGDAIAYGWWSLPPRNPRHRASSPQSGPVKDDAASSSGVTKDRSLFNSLFPDAILACSRHAV